MRKKDIRYEIVEAEPQARKSSELVHADAKEVDAERDGFEELKAAVNSVTRLRMRVKRDLSSRYGFVLFFMFMIILIGSFIIGYGDIGIGTVVISAIILASVVVSVIFVIIFKVKERTPDYCYYACDERGVFCMSVIGDSATVFAYGICYRIEGDAFYTLDEAGYMEWLDGEGMGILSALAAKRSRFEMTEDGTYIVNGSHGGSHEYLIEDGKIQKIVSMQPQKTDVVDPKTGMAKTKLKRFDKDKATEHFAWEVPAFVRDDFDAAGVDLPDMSEL